MSDSIGGCDLRALPGENCAVSTFNGESGFLLCLLDSDLIEALLCWSFSRYGENLDFDILDFVRDFDFNTVSESFDDISEPSFS